MGTIEGTLRVGDSVNLQVNILQFPTIAVARSFILIVTSTVGILRETSE